MNTRCSIKLCAIAFCCVSIFAAAAMAKPHKEEKHEKYERREGKKGHSRKGEGESYFHKHGYANLFIPPDHYPPPGECRIWYPNRPKGHKPERIKCGVIPPPGAWVIHQPRRHQGYLNIRAYDPQRPNIPIGIGEFELKSGGFIRMLDSDNND